MDKLNIDIPKHGNEKFFFIRKTIETITVIGCILLVASCVVDISHPESTYRRNEEMAGKIFLYLFFLILALVLSCYAQVKIEKAYVSKESLDKRNEDTRKFALVQLKEMLGPLYPIFEFIIQFFKKNKGE